MALPLIKKATSESSQGRAGDTRGIRKKELLSALLGDELLSKMLPVTLGNEGVWEGGWAGTVPRTHTHVPAHSGGS